MARFVLDICVNSDKEYEEMFSKISDLLDKNVKLYTITTIDKTNENQFHNNPNSNMISDKQLENYMDSLNIIKNPTEREKNIEENIIYE